MPKLVAKSRCPAFPALLQIGGTDTRREQKLTAGMLDSVLPCTLSNDKFF